MKLTIFVVTVNIEIDTILPKNPPKQDSPLPFKCTEVNFTVMRIPHIRISDFRMWTGNLNTITILFLDHHRTQTPLVMLTHFDEIFDLCARRKACARLVFPVNYNISDPMVAPIANPFLNDQILRKTSPPCQLVCILTLSLPLK